jgi:hypothetical protein
MEAAFLRIGQSTVRSELTNVTGARGVGTYRLALNLEWSPTSFDELEGAKILLGGELQASFAQDAPLPLAQLQAIYAMAFPSRALVALGLAAYVPTSAAAKSLSWPENEPSCERSSIRAFPASSRRPKARRYPAPR